MARDPAGRVPVNDPDAECAVICAALLGDISPLQSVLVPEDFYGDAAQVTWRACCELAAASTPIDTTTVAGHLRASGLIQRIGGAVGLQQMLDTLPVVANWRAYERTIIALSVQRQAVARLQAEAAAGYDTLPDVAGWLAATAHDLRDMSSRALTGAATTAAEAVALTSQPDIVGLQGTGFPGLDEATGGLRPGEAIVLSGESKGGKTAFSAQLGANVASTGSEVLFFSLEMPTRQIMSRLICSAASVPAADWNLGRLKPEQWESVAQAKATCAALPMSFDDERIRTAQSIVAHATRHAEMLARADRGRLRLIIIDYLQLLDSPPPGRNDTREMAVRRDIKALVRLSEDLRTTVLVCAQTNKQGDIRECGAVVHWCHAWWHLNNPFQPTLEERACALELRRQRHGASGIDVDLRFDARTVTFRDGYGGATFR